ncbi:hypothetical protein ABIA26_004647 [Sinorhizobium fredii]
MQASISRFEARARSDPRPTPVAMRAKPRARPFIGTA